MQRLKSREGLREPTEEPIRQLSSLVAAKVDVDLFTSRATAQPFTLFCQI